MQFGHNTATRGLTPVCSTNSRGLEQSFCKSAVHYSCMIVDLENTRLGRQDSGTRVNLFLIRESPHSIDYHSPTATIFQAEDINTTSTVFLSNMEEY